MSGSLSAPPARPERDPVLRVLGGCALVGGGLAVLIIVAVVAVGWRLTRDETPGRPVEVFLAGDETRYWCLDLKPEDAGIAALVSRMDASAEAARTEALKNSPLRFLPLPQRRNQVAQLLPLKLELAASAGGWAGRATFSQGVLRIRAVLKVVRWVIGRDSKSVTSVEPGGPEVTAFQDPRSQARFAMTMVGNRLLLASGTERLAKALAIDRAPSASIDPAVAPLHESIRLEGEDGWAFASGPSVASFDVDGADELVFRIVTEPATAMDAAQARALARTWIPYVDDDALELDAGSPSPRADGRWVVAGRVTDLSGRLAATLLRFSASRMERTPGAPSATPPRPSPPRSSDRRTDTPAAPKHEGIPTPPR